MISFKRLFGFFAFLFSFSFLAHGFDFKRDFSPSFFLSFGPMVLVNTDSTAESAPSPVMYALGGGLDFFPESSFSFQTKVSFFTNYYLWTGEEAKPAEVENRTATAISFLLDLCGGKKWIFGKNSISLDGGLGFLFRYGILSNGVEESDKNPVTGTSAKDDIKDINSDFFDFMNMIYPEIAFSYSRSIFDGWKAGVESRIYFPLGSLSNGGGFDNMLFSLSFKLNFPGKSKKES